jgi:kynurenine formamidase
MLRFLSYPLGPSTPTYGDNPPVRFAVLSDMNQGGVANWLEFCTINHNGTHLDAPYHFNPRGKRVSELAPEEFVFERPGLLELPLEDGELITAETLKNHADAIGNSDLLLVRTGWAERYRASDPVRFGRRAPGFAASAGRYLLEHYPTLRAVGMDLPSAASPVEGEPNAEGLEFHRVVLRTGEAPGERYLLLIEDMNLEGLTVPPGKVWIVPLRLLDADAAPVTALAELREPRG